MKVLVTGHAGFIGSALTLRLLERGDEIVGVDNLNDYYDPGLKRARIARHTAFSRYTDVIADITDRTMIEELFTKYQPERVLYPLEQRLAKERLCVETPR